MGFVIVDEDLEKLLADASNLANIMQAIRSALGQPNDPSNFNTVNGKLNRIIKDLEDPTTGLVFGYGQRVNILLDLFNLATSVTALGAPQQAGSPVTLPSTPPTGYGGLDAADTFSAVWLTPYGSDLVTMYTYAKYGGIDAYSLGQSTGYRPDGGIFAYYYTPLLTDGSHGTFYPIQDFTTILANDDLLTWLTRINPTATCFWWSGPGSSVGVNGNNGDGPANFLTVFDDAHFQRIKEVLALGPPASQLNVWPGLANVTLGTPLALSAATDLSEVCNGVIIALSATPPGKPTYQIGSVLATAHIGQIAFFNDNGDMEYPQNLSMPDQVYVPQTMAAAAGARVRCVPGVAGTITAWTINP